MSSVPLHMLHVTLDTSSLLRCTCFMLRWIHLLYFLAHSSCCVGYVFCTSLHILHVTFDTSSVLRCTYFMFRWIPSSLLPCAYFMLRWIRLLYFVAHASCYVGYVFCTSLHILGVTLDRCSLLPCTYFMLRWICLLYCCTCFMLRWVRLLYFPAHTSCSEEDHPLYGRSSCLPGCCREVEHLT